MSDHLSRRKSRARWDELYDWRPVERRRATPIAQQTYLQVRAAILSGGLRAGMRLPSTRNLAARLNVARACVVEAYEQLTAEGYIAARIGSGTFVSADLPEPIVGARRAAAQAAPARALPKTNDPLDNPRRSEARPFNTGRTLLDARTLAIWRRLTYRAVRNFGAADLGYADPCGSPELRRAVCDYLAAARAVRCTPEQVIITAGTQHAIDLVIRALLRPGDQVWTEDPGYPPTRQALTAAGLSVRPVAVDDQGLVVRAGLKSASKARAAFVTPSHQYPTGVVLSMARRLELLAWAREDRRWIVEDDYASEFRYSGRPLASLQGLDDGDRVIYIGTLNKALFPGLRLGYAVVPTSVIARFAEARSLVDRQPPSLNQSVVAEFMQQGHLSAHIRRMRLQYRAQRDALAAELVDYAGERIAPDIPDQGMHLVAYLNGGLSDLAIAGRAHAAGIVARPMSPLYAVSPPRSGLILGFSGYPQRSIVAAARALAGIVMDQPTEKARARNRR